MDYVFSRLHTGYDAIVLAYRQEDGQYDAYLLGKEKGQEQFMFRTEKTEEKDILNLVREWAAKHLTSDAKLILAEECSTLEQYRHLKERLRTKKITYEVKGKSFYVRRGDLRLLDTV